MPEELNLDDVRLKDASELSEEEKPFLKEHKDELTEAEIEAFSEAVDFREEEEKKEEEEEKKEEPFAFKSQEEFDKAVEDKLQATLDERARKRREEKEAKKREAPLGEPEKIFEKEPKDWEEAGRRIVEYKDKRDMARATAVRQEIDTANREFDEQIVEIRRANPDLPATGTEEGDKFDRKLAEVGAKYKLSTMTDAYEIWKDTEGGKGGGISKTQKGLASKVGKGGGGGAPAKKRSYGEVAGRSMDEAEEAAVKKFRSLK